MRAALLFGNRPRDMMLRDALINGFTVCGVHVDDVKNAELDEIEIPDTDLAVFFGIRCHKLIREAEARGIPIMLIDKGYFNRNLYLRVSLGGYQPPYFDELDYDSSRLTRTLRVTLAPRNHKSNKLVVYAGSSQKYCSYHGLGDATEYATKVCAELEVALQGQKRIWYRPKPSWYKGYLKRENKPPGSPEQAQLDPLSDRLWRVLQNAHCLVTHGSNAAVEALVHGVPVIMLSPPGVSPVRTLCETKIANVLDPYWPSDSDRVRVLSNLAWCQFTLEEIASGFMWNTLKQWYGYKPKGVANASGIGSDQL